MNEIRVKIDEMIEELEKMKSSGNEYVTLTIEEAELEEGIPAHIMLDDSGCVIQYRRR